MSEHLNKGLAVDVAHHTVLFGPRYKGLFDDIFKGSRLPDFSLDSVPIAS